jgi:hypothetical protein
MGRERVRCVMVEIAKEYCPPMPSGIGGLLF